MNWENKTIIFGIIISSFIIGNAMISCYCGVGGIGVLLFFTGLIGIIIFPIILFIAYMSNRSPSYTYTPDDNWVDPIYRRTYENTAPIRNPITRRNITPQNSPSPRRDPTRRKLRRIG